MSTCLMKSWTWWWNATQRSSTEWRTSFWPRPLIVFNTKSLSWPTPSSDGLWLWMMDAIGIYWNLIREQCKRLTTGFCAAKACRVVNWRGLASFRWRKKRPMAWLSNRSPFAILEAQAAGLLKQMLLALSYLHSHGVVHRDSPTCVFFQHS